MAERLITPEMHVAEVIKPQRASAAEKRLSAEALAEHQERQSVAVEQARRAVAEHAAAKAESTAKAPVDDRPVRVDSAAKVWRMRQSMARVQKRLTPAQKSLSGVIHQPLVRRVSEVAAETVARPSGILGGGLLAFLGSSAYLWFARAAGISYNYLGFFVFFIGGFLLGLVVEHALAALRRH